MTVRLSGGAKNAALDVGAGAMFDGGTARINIYTGSQPATADTAASGTLLGTLTPSSDMFAAASGGTATANSITNDSSADASGLPGYVRIYRTGDTAPGSAGNGTTDRRLDMAAGVRSTLPAGINNVVTTITLASTQGFPTSGTVLIDSEQITYSGISSNDLTGCTRGANSTSAASHSSAAVVYQAGVEVTFDNSQFSGGGLVAGGVISMSSLTLTQP